MFLQISFLELKNSLIKVNIEFDYTALGYTSQNSSKFGFYTEKCAITNADAPATKFFLIGSDNNSLNKNCLLNTANVDLGQRMEYLDQTSWTKTEFNLEFLAFRFPTSGNLTAVCDLKICLEGDCATESTQTC